MNIKFDHLAVQIPHHQLQNTVKWYKDFFDCKENWSQHSSFEPLTKERIPGIKSIVELESIAFRFHIFTRFPLKETIAESYIQNHHVGFSVDQALAIDLIKNKWKSLYDSEAYSFSKIAYITEKMIDSLGVHSIYFTDVNGLEFEVTYVPQEALYDREYTEDAITSFVVEN